MNKQTLTILSATLIAGSVLADGTVFDGRWRLSVGYALDAGVKTDFRFNPRAPKAPSFPSSGSKAAAEAQALGTVNGTRTDFPNGAWIDTNDPVSQWGDDFGLTRYYTFPASTWDGNRTFVLGSASYAESSSSGAPKASNWTETDEDRIPGFNVELARNLYTNAEWRCGVDFAVGFQLFRQDDVYHARSSWKASASQTVGTMTSSITIPEEDYDEWNWHGEGAGRYYGCGSYEGNAGPIDGTAIRVSQTESSRSRSVSGSLRVDADYEDMELLFLLRPYYDCTDWFRVQGTVGLVVSREDLDLYFNRSERRDYVARKHEIHEWDVYGVVGLGAQARYRDFTLAAEASLRVWDPEMDVRDEYVEGTLERGDWFGKISIGYEF